MKKRKAKIKEIKIEIPLISKQDAKDKDTMHLEEVRKTKIRIIGIGSGGGAIVSEITSRVKKADFVIANTDSRALKDPKIKARKFQFGYDLTKGLGTGMNVLVGEAAALADNDKIINLLEDHDLCIIIASLGGGTSSGASPVFAKISRDLGNLTYGIFTLPFKFEGEKKMEAARESLEKIKPYLNIYSVIPNEKIFEIVDRNTPLKDALSAINRKLADNLEGLMEMIYTPGLINIDFADLKTVLSGKGRLAYLNTVEIEQAERENKEEIIKKVIYSSLYPYTPKGAKGILLNLGDSKNIQLAEVSQISNTILQSVNKDAKIIFGINQSLKPNPKFRISLLATGCIGRDFFEKPEKMKEEAAVLSKKQKVVSKKIIQIKKIAKKMKARKPVKKKIVKRIRKVKKVNRKTVKTKKAVSAKSKIKAKVEKQVKKAEIKGNMIVTEKEPVLPVISQIPVTKISVTNFDNHLKVRKNAMQLKKEIEEAENDLIEKEKMWDVPAILRKKNFK
jgi:cell division protein FtsZ